MAGRFKYTANQLIKKNLPKGIEIDTDELSEQLSIVIEQSVQDWERAGREAMKDIRCSAMSTWISNRKSGRYIAYRESIKFSKSLVDQDGNGHIDITIRSYLDSDTFSSIFESVSSAYSSLYNWREKHSESGWSYGEVEDGNPIDMPLSIGEYALINMWSFGYTSLPPKEFDTGTGWVNKKYSPSKHGALSTYSDNQLIKQWRKKVNEFYGKV